MNKVKFNDYSTEELCEIAKYIVDKTNMKLSEEGLEKLTAIFNKVRNIPNFGNGRFVRNLIEKAQMNSHFWYSLSFPATPPM